jgi:hypothetical protein
MPEAPTGGVTFKLAQPMGQKSVYALKSNGEVSMGSAEGETLQRAEVVMDATLNMEVTSSEPDGKWSLSGQFADVALMFNEQNQPEMASKMSDQKFTVTYDKDGKVLNIAGLEQVEGGIDMKQMASQMNPANIFPKQPVNVGDSWPVEFTESSQVEGDTITETTKGTGTLKELSNGRATLEYDLNKQMAASPSRGPNVGMNGGGKVKTTMVFDIEKSRIVSSQSDMKVEATMQMRMGARSETTHSVFTNKMNLELVNK